MFPFDASLGVVPPAAGFPSQGAKSWNGSGETFLGRLNNQAGPDAAGADANTADSPIFSFVADVLEIGQPESFRFVIGVADIVADMRMLAAELTFPAHGLLSFPLAIRRQKNQPWIRLLKLSF
jgi:hypothetical protein